MKTDPASSRVQFYRDLARLAAHLEARQADDRDSELELFHRRIMAGDGSNLRKKLLGANVLRLRKLEPMQRRALDVLAISPDLLSPLGDLRYEPAHTQVLAFLMSPRRGFPLATKFLATFLGLANVGDECERLNLADANVRAEYSKQSGRVDIAIDVPGVSSDGLVIYVEVKVDALEGYKQLERYESELKTEAGNRPFKLVYLTLHGTVPSTIAERVTLEEVFTQWLRVLATHGLDLSCAYGAAYLKSLALLTGKADHGTYDEWNFARQRSALAFVSNFRE
jgi:hypothetical protein